MHCDNASSKPSAPGRHFYAVQHNGDGTADVYLLQVYSPYEAQLRLMRGIVPWPKMEEDIRARFDDWCESAEVPVLP